MHRDSIISCKLTCLELILLSSSHFIDGNTEAGRGLIGIFVSSENGERKNQFHNFEPNLKQALIKYWLGRWTLARTISLGPQGVATSHVSQRFKKETPIIHHTSHQVQSGPNIYPDGYNLLRSNQAHLI